MYKVRDKVYADAGCILIGKNALGYILTGETKDFIEERVTIDDMRIDNGFLCYSNGLIREMHYPTYTYEQMKSRIIKRQFSNDDQIAIILNKDSGEEADLIAYNKMQEWREWASVVAKKILEVSAR
jgi:hypothetical protein